MHEAQKRIDWIKNNLSTRHKWTKSDYAEFYEGDIPFLLAEITRLQSLIDSHAKEHLCLRRHGADERPEGDRVVFVETNPGHLYKAEHQVGTTHFLFLAKISNKEELVLGKHDIKAWYELPEGGSDEPA